MIDGHFVNLHPLTINDQKKFRDDTKLIEKIGFVKMS